MHYVILRVRVTVSRANHDAFRSCLRVSSGSFDFVIIRIFRDSYLIMFIAFLFIELDGCERKWLMNGRTVCLEHRVVFYIY
jgi:hypothetical protein